MLSRFIHVVACITFHSFLWLNSQWQDIPHFVYLLSVDGQFGCSHFLAIVNNTAMNICTYVFVYTRFHFS